MLRRIADPLRLTALLPLRLTRYVSLVVARGAHRWELLVEQALTDPVVLRGWDGASNRAADPQPPAPGPPERTHVVDLTDDDLADWAQMPFASASARAADVDGEGLRALLDYERAHGHRPRFEQLLRRRLDEVERDESNAG